MQGDVKGIRARYKAIPVGERYWWKVVALSFAGWIIMYAARTILNPVQTLIGAEFGLNNTQLGLLNSVFFLAYALAQIPFGALGDRIGRRLVICVGFITFGLATLFSGLAMGIAMLIAMRIMAGIGEGTYYGPQYALSAEAIPTKKITLGTAIINSGMAFGTSGGYLLSSKLVLANGEHWSRPFFIMAVPTIIVGVLFMVVLKERVVRPEDKDAAAKEEAVLTEPAEKASLASIFKNRNLLCAFFMCFFSIYANFVIITWLPQFLQVERGFEGTSVGFISSLVPWASIPGALIFARMSDKFKRTKLFAFILVPLAALSVFGIAFVTNRTLLIAMLIIYGVSGKLALDPILVAFVTKNAPRHVLGTVLSCYNFIGMSGSILAPYVTGFLSDRAGSMKIGFYLAAAMLLIGLFIFSFIKEEKTQTA